MKKILFRREVVFIGFILLATLLISRVGFTPQIQEMKYVDFMAAIDNKEVSEVSIRDNAVYFELDGLAHTTAYPSYPEFKKDLLESGVEVDVVSTTTFGSVFFDILPLVIMIILVVFLFKMFSGNGNLGPNTKRNFSAVEKPSTKFSDVAGIEDVKRDVMNIVELMKNPQKFRRMGAKMPRGLMLSGPPGTGKTLLAKAIAGESGVAFHSVSGSEFIEKFVGVGAQRIRDLFEEARKNAPAIIFFDEIDAIGTKRQEDMSGEQVQTLNALLSEMDGFNDEDGLFVIATTNRLDALDNALKRAGRFDMHVHVPLPHTAAERLEIMHVHKKGIPFSSDVSFEQLAKEWMGFSGADIASLFNQSALVAIEQNKDVVDAASIEEAFNRKIIGGHLKRGVKNQDTAERKLIAYHEAGHAVAEILLETGKELAKVTIIPTTTGAGGFALSTPQKMGLLTIQELENEVKMTYAGRVAELLLFGKKDLVTTGASQDIKQATELIKHMVATYGMVDDVGMLDLTQLGDQSKTIADEARKLAARLYEETEILLRDNWEKIILLAETLLERETLTGAEVTKLLEVGTLPSVELTKKKEPTRLANVLDRMTSKKDPAIK